MGHCELALTTDLLRNFGEQYFEAKYSFLVGLLVLHVEVVTQLTTFLLSL